ncbi:hypothetical protein PROFUN_06682 [Planoprotostelium fungivorum]|uniref:Uncharacterized protein n=1 Tax=Planoprotostelium fungivorum TaxID=1890364 RepID=A0A2P6NG42_9EUKA|nr:hypothetical protein PROFUN_06682 [Planoprotostelium fungivorum]
MGCFNGRQASSQQEYVCAAQAHHRLHLFMLSYDPFFVHHLTLLLLRMRLLTEFFAPAGVPTSSMDPLLVVDYLDVSLIGANERQPFRIDDTKKRRYRSSSVSPRQRSTSASVSSEASNDNFFLAPPLPPVDIPEDPMPKSLLSLIVLVTKPPEDQHKKSYYQAADLSKDWETIKRDISVHRKRLNRFMRMAPRDYPPASSFWKLHYGLSGAPTSS